MERRPEEGGSKEDESVSVGQIAMADGIDESSALSSRKKSSCRKEPDSNTNNNGPAVSDQPRSVVKKRNVEEEEEDSFTVPDVEALQVSAAAINENCGGGTSSSYGKHQEATADQQHRAAGAFGKRRQGRNLADKEHKRLRRLLRNRVSAQQARERKKVYASDLESRTRELQDSNSRLEEKISTLINENTMLRKILMNTRTKVDEGDEQKQ